MKLEISVLRAEASVDFERILQDFKFRMGSSRKESGSLVISSTGRFFSLGSWLRLSTNPLPSKMGIWKSLTTKRKDRVCARANPWAPSAASTTSSNPKVLKYLAFYAWQRSYHRPKARFWLRVVLEKA